MAVYTKFNSTMLQNIVGVSYIGNPQDYTMMYLTKKIESKISCLVDTHNSILFLEDGIVVPKEISENNIIIITQDPAKEYTNVALALYEKIEAENKRRKFHLTDGGYYIGENVQMGVNVVIEPGAFIDHDVILMDDVTVKSGAKIRYGTIVGAKSTICENVVIGDPAFNTSKNENGSIDIIPSFGKVLIGSNVYIGANTTISRGSASDTIIDNEVKIDSNIRVGHDVRLHRGVELLGCAAIAGYCEIGENSVIAINATLKNRITVGKDCFVGMGSVVHHNVKDGLTMSGSPARTMTQIGEKNYLEAQLKELLRDSNISKSRDI